MPSFRELLAQTKARITEIDARGRRSAGSATPRSSTSASRTSTSRARSRASVYIPRGHLESQVETKLTDQGRADRRLLRRRHPLRVRGRDARAARLHRRRLDGRRLRPVEERGPRRGSRPRSLTAEQRNRYQRHILLPEVGEAGQQKLLESQGAAARRRRPRLPRRAVPRGRGRRHARHRRHGRRRRVEPAAPDPPQHGPHRRAQGRLGQEDAHAAQPRRRTSSPTTCASAPTTCSTSSTATTSSSTAPTTSRPATCSTTRRC